LSKSTVSSRSDLLQQPAFPVHGILAVFNTPAEILKAARSIRQLGLKHWDVFTPFPVPGMDQTMGIDASRIGRFAFAAGIFGFASGMALCWWTNAVDYPLFIGGKPMFSPWAALPVAFETTILFAAIVTFAGMLKGNRLPRLHHPLLKNRRFATASNDRFILVVEKHPEEDITRALNHLKSCGASHLEWVRE
jgi:hypothetical protein